MGMCPATISLGLAGVNTVGNLVGGKNQAKQQSQLANQYQSLINNPLPPAVLSAITGNVANANNSAINTATSRGAYGANQNAVINNLLLQGQQGAEQAAASAAASAAGNIPSYLSGLSGLSTSNPYGGFMNSLPGLVNAYNAANPGNSGIGIPAMGNASFGSWGDAAGAAGAGAGAAAGYTPNPSLSPPLNYPLYNTSSSTNPAFSLTYPMGASGDLPSLNSILAGSTLSAAN